MYIHLKEDQFLIPTHQNKDAITELTLNIANNKEVAYGKLDLKRQFVTRLNKPEEPCQMYQSEREYSQCIRNVVWAFSRENLKCIIPGTRKFYHQS